VYRNIRAHQCGDGPEPLPMAPRPIASNQSITMPESAALVEPLPESCPAEGRALDRPPPVGPMPYRPFMNAWNFASSDRKWSPNQAIKRIETSSTIPVFEPGWQLSWIT